MSSDRYTKEIAEYFNSIKETGVLIDPYFESSIYGCVREAYWHGHEDGRNAYRDALREVRAEDDQRMAEGKMLDPHYGRY